MVLKLPGIMPDIYGEQRISSQKTGTELLKDYLKRLENRRFRKC